MVAHASGSGEASGRDLIRTRIGKRERAFRERLGNNVCDPLRIFGIRNIIRLEKAGDLANSVSLLAQNSGDNQETDRVDDGTHYSAVVAMMDDVR